MRGISTLAFVSHAKRSGEDEAAASGDLPGDSRSGRIRKLAEPYRTLFISGAGRSGSTIASMLLAQRNDVVNIGEIGNLWRDGFSADLLCGCGRAYVECEFWSAVVEESFGSFAAVPTAEMNRLWKRIHRNSLMPLILSNALRGSLQEDYQAYLAALNRLYLAITRISGKRVIVDASKRAIHGLLLSKLPGADLHVLHWVRDSRAVVFSSQRRKRREELTREVKYLAQRNVFESTYQWIHSNLWAEVLETLDLPKLTMRYEDFAVNPLVELRRITDFIGVSPSSADLLDLAADDFCQSHSILGNPTRFTDRLEIRPDFEWQQQLAGWKKAVATIATLPLLLRYGYLTSHENGS